jgi:hypothetical protein
MPLVDTKLVVSATATQTNPLDLMVAKASVAFEALVSLGSGTGSGQADRLWTDRRTLAASGSEDLDLAGVLTDAFGATITFARVKGLIVKAAAANSNNVIVGGAAATQWATWAGAATHTVTVRPGGAFALFAPDATAYAVTAGTGDLLKIANSGAGTTVDYDIVVIGASA